MMNLHDLGDPLTFLFVPQNFHLSGDISQNLLDGFAKNGTDINDSQMMNPNELGDPLTFHPAPSSDQNFYLSYTL